MDPFDKKINQMKYYILEKDKEIKEIQKVSLIIFLNINFIELEKQSCKRKLIKKNRKFKK